MRAFVAAAADPAWVESSRAFVARVRPGLPKASWTRAETWHLTLRFLGDIEESAAPAFTRAFAPEARAFAEAELATDGPVVLPPRGRPRVLGVGFGAGAALDGLARLAAAAEGAARSIGCAPEERPFRAHVTLARLRDPWPDAAVAAFQSAARDWEFPSWTVRSIVLFSSRLDPAGAVHAPVESWVAAPRPVEAPA
ncbi:MAG TPA: RNA 2',3'-cyclic phosphodiesterase [Thermoanaerobaculia bacterium]|nr:RNA 2',3'-cyclic phosphodiesterase [Thermoanaerobaculia bacterium]